MGWDRDLCRRAVIFRSPTFCNIELLLLMHMSKIPMEEELDALIYILLQILSF